MQLVRMMQGGEVVRMSKRTGKSLTLTDLLDEIPVDAARFFFNSRAAETQMEFDLDLAIKQIPITRCTMCSTRTRVSALCSRTHRRAASRCRIPARPICPC